MCNRIRLTLVIVCLCLFSVSAADPADERILLTFIPNIQFSPFYIGIDGGHFEQAGFNVTLEHLQEPDVLDLVAVGQANFGIVSGEQVILARAQGRDVVYVFEWFQQYPVGLVYSSALDLSELSLMSGLKVGIPGRFGASYSGLTTLLRSAGLTEDDIEVAEIGFNAPEVFCLGTIDAAVVYVNNEPLQIRERARAGECGAVADVDVITVASQVDLVSNGLIVSREMLTDEPSMVERMARALGAALQEAIDNPAGAYLASLNHVDALPQSVDFVAALQAASERQRTYLAADPDRAAIARSRWDLAEELAANFEADLLTQFFVLLHTIDLWESEQLGYSDLASWEAMRDTLDLMGFLRGDLGDLADAFTNEFVSGSDG